MKKILITLIAIGIIQLFSQTAQAQSAEQTNDTWYVWIDVTIPIDGKSTRIISAKPNLLNTGNMLRNWLNGLLPI